MPCKIFLLFFQIIILCNEYNLTIAKPLIGYNIKEANETEFQFVVCLLKVDARVLPINIFCAGSLITRSLVLTAEHCLENLPSVGFEVRAGSKNVMLATKYASAWMLSYKNWIIIHNATSRYRLNDIAFIKLTIPVFSDIIPVTTSIVPNKDIVGFQAITAGWGKTINNVIPTILQTVNLKIISNKECTNNIIRLTKEYSFISFAQICSSAVPYAFLEDGDSGGPLIIADILVGVNIGTCPHLDGNFHAEKINIHSSIYFYRNFISYVLEEN